MTTCALVAACDFNASHFRESDELGLFDEVYAVDAGFAHLEAIGRKCDLAIGDFDSLGYVPSARRVSRHPAKKDKSDLELALERVASYHFDEVVVYGAIGGRLDHTLANFQLFAKFAEAGMGVTAIADTFAVRVVVGPDVFEIPENAMGTVSVFAFTPEARGVIERGMEYSLDDETLTARTSRGLSNELTGEPAAVAVEEGTLLVFFPLETAAAEKRVKKVVVTGGACAGKTAALDELRKRFAFEDVDVRFVDEAATDLINDGFAPGPLHTALEFQIRVVAMQLEREAAAELELGEGGLIVCDRGVCDGAAYLSHDEFVQALAANGLDEESARARYDAVFCLESVAKGKPDEYSCESNGARMETLEEAIALNERTREAWVDHPHFEYIPYADDFSQKVDRLFAGIVDCLKA